MVLYVYSPQWFYGLDSIFEVVSVIVGLLIALYGYKTYRYTSQRRYLHFAASFFLVAFAFLINILSNFIYYTKSLENKVIELTAIDVVVIKQITWVSRFGSLIGVFFMLLAFLLLFITVYKINDKKINLLLVYLVFVAALYSKHSFIFFHGTLLVLISLIFAYYYKNYRAKHTKNRVFVALSFLMMALSQLFFMISAFSGFMFVAAQTAQLVGYLILLFTIILVLKK